MEQQQDRLIRLPAVIALTGWKRTKIYKLIRDGKFPRPIPLGTTPNAPNAWSEKDVMAWHAAWVEECKARAAERRPDSDKMRALRSARQAQPSKAST
jgi:prophage regulatory protein